MEAIKVSEEAAKWAKQQIDKRGKGLGIKLGVKTSGCSGYQYVIEYVDETSADDFEFEYYGVVFYVDPKSHVYLSGSILEFKQEGLNSGLEFVNPNVVGECGCGESFSV